MRARAYLQGARPKTLPLAIAPVAIGAAASVSDFFPHQLEQLRAFRETGTAHGYTSCLAHLNSSTCTSARAGFITVLVLCACVALFLQVAANFANDYSDGIRGTDAERADEDELGAPRRLVAGGVNPKEVLACAVVNVLLACACGIAVVCITKQWVLLLVGALCMLAGWFYVGGEHPYGYRGLGELMAFLFFGPVACLGTQFALAGRVNVSGWYGGVCAGLVAAATLMINNLRDREDDWANGKRTLVVILGRQLSLVLLGTLLFAAVVMTTQPGVNFLDLLNVYGVGNSGDAPFSPALVNVCACAVVASMGLPVAAFVTCVKRKFAVSLPLCTCSAIAIAVSFVCYAWLM